MQILVVGCGRVGAAVIEQLVDAGQDVIVIDQNATQLARIDHVKCQKIIGIPIDQNVLMNAGIEFCDAFLGLSDQENMNAMAAGIAKSFYNVPHCVIRVFNPANVSLYHAQGLKTISQTELVMASVLSNLGFVPTEDDTDILGYPFKFSLTFADSRLNGLNLNQIYQKFDIHIFATVKDGSIELVNPETVIHKGDQIVIVSKGK